MGFFSTLREVNEATHGKRLERQFRETVELMHTFDAPTYSLVVNKFLTLLFSLQKKVPEMSASEGLRLGRDMADSARKLSKTNSYDACALWLAAAWMESGNRSSDEADRAHAAIEKFALDARKKNFEAGEPPALWEYPPFGRQGMPQYELGAGWYKKTIKDASAGFWKDVPYATGRNDYNEYSYIAIIFMGDNETEIWVARGQNDDGTEFEDCFYSNGKTIYKKKNVKPFFQGEDGFDSSVVDIVNIMRRKHS